MSRSPDLNKILSSGSAKQRALLLANHIADVNAGGKGLLSQNEYNSLTKSFRKEGEIEVYNRYRRMFDKVQVFLTNVSQFRLAYMYALKRLENLIIIRKNNADMEDLTNRLLALIQEKQVRKKAIKVTREFSDPSILRLINVDKEGFIEIIQEGGILDSGIEDARAEVESEQVNLKTAIQVIKDYLDDNGFKVKRFTSYIRIVEAWAKSKTEKGLVVMFQGNQLQSLDPSIRELARKYFIEPDYKSVQIDQEKYEELRRSYFDE